MTNKPYRVLCLDGGGIRGVYTATVLQQMAVRVARLSGKTQEEHLDLGANFDLIVGTSTGSILAVALAAGVALEDVSRLYREKAVSIFQRPMPLQDGCFSTKMRTLGWVLHNLFSPANESAPLRTALQPVLKEETLEQMFRRRNIALCVPTIDAESQRAWVFKTPHGARLTRDNNYKLVDVCMASAAAPVFFPMHAVKSPNPGVSAPHLFVDGGLWGNNPVLVGLVEALEFAAPGQKIEILSVGTCAGNKARTLNVVDAPRGSWQWRGGSDIVTLSLEAQASVYPYLASKIVQAMSDRVSLHRLLEPHVSGEESKHLALDANDQKSLDVLEMLGQRATDLNMSALTNSPQSSAEHAMVLDMFSNLNQLREDKQ
ncbi:MAG: CBASS cGAMP-activated phospholipase [Actinomycetota bacterium]|uniref:CBASS cGAMP-activated phospholipase n=1 Tax=Hydrogenophaga sp. TaxID=1904254 RepID=UPI00286E4757|nr:CBASS cGAMP-activated phospholipase [Hydrogenophaga sp.]